MSSHEGAPRGGAPSGSGPRFRPPPMSGSLTVDFQQKLTLSDAQAVAPENSNAPGGAIKPPEAAKAIAAIQFGTLTGAEMVLASTLQICSKELYRMPLRLPAPYGVLDSRLGVSGKSESCATCSRKLQDCAGHFGFIKLELPVFHIGFLKATVELLQVRDMCW